MRKENEGVAGGVGGYMKILGGGKPLPEARLSHQHKALRFNCGKCCRERNEM